MSQNIEKQKKKQKQKVHLNCFLAFVKKFHKFCKVTCETKRNQVVKDKHYHMFMEM